MKLGIVGLPNVGKSTLFNAITKAGIEAANYPFCTIDPNVGVVTVPDPRIDKLHEIYNSKKTVYTTIEFADIAGLVKGASKGEGLGNQFLGHIRETDAIIHVVRCFDNDNIVHVNGVINPIDDIDTINTELILADLEMIEKAILKMEKSVKADKTLKTSLDTLLRIRDVLENGKAARTADLDDDERTLIKPYNLLTAKPIIYVANISENALVDTDNKYVRAVTEFAKSENAKCVTICADIESELSELDNEDRIAYLDELGISESGLDKLIKASYSLLDLISFLTAGQDEVRAWTIKRGTKAPEAAGKIHSDFEKGFIRAETISYDKLMECGGLLSKARERGFIRSEGKNYVMQDGDVVNFLFNV